MDAVLFGDRDRARSMHDAPVMMEAARVMVEAGEGCAADRDANFS